LIWYHSLFCLQWEVADQVSALQKSTKTTVITGADDAEAADTVKSIIGIDLEVLGLRDMNLSGKSVFLEPSLRFGSFLPFLWL
jgi:hypothetical protein